MCGRITQSSSPDQLGLKVVSLIEPLDGPRRYNGAPGQQHLVIRQHPKTGERTLDRLWWGLIPHWCIEPRKPDDGQRALEVRQSPYRRLARTRTIMRSPAITVCIFFFSILLASGKARALDVNQACNGDFNRYCSRYDAYSTSGKACVRSMGRSHRLNKDCLRALEEGGYVTQADRDAYKKRGQ